MGFSMVGKYVLDITSFNNAITYDMKYPWQTDLAVLAKQDGEIVGVAGASKPVQNCGNLA